MQVQSLLLETQNSNKGESTDQKDRSKAEMNTWRERVRRSAVKRWLSHSYRSLLSAVCLPSGQLSGEGNGTPLQYPCLENPMDGGAWWAAVHGVMKSWTQLSDFTFTFYFHALEKEMATHSSVLAWRIPGMGEPGGLPSMGSHRVGHD